MARLPITEQRRKLKKLLLLQQTTNNMLVLLFALYYVLICSYLRDNVRHIKTKEEKRVNRMRWMCRLTMDCDSACISQLRMDRATFRILCDMVANIGGLKPTKNTSIEEVVAMFIYTLAHHKKSRTISLLFYRSTETVSRQFHQVLNAILKLYPILLKKPELITQDCQDEKWKCFQGCLGALDGTLIKVTPPTEDKPRYRTRKGRISTNVLGVCCPNMQFIYVLPGWEGSAHDGRVLRDVISRPHGLRVPRGCYYLVDSGYCNANGFLVPYRGQRYHLKEFDGHQPETPEEYFNMKHSKARNVIERCFGLLKGRWKILASPSFFSIQTQIRIIMACCLMHNLIRKFMSFDPQESLIADEEEESDRGSDNEEVEYITQINPSNGWSSFRNNMATNMYNTLSTRPSGNVILLDIIRFIYWMTTITPSIARGRGKNKQYWTDEEVEVLVDALIELTSDPLWKVDTGFKNGYMVQIHKMVLGKIPSFNKAIIPHIESKIKYLKTKYNPLYEMCMQSGCQWDDMEHKINCEKQWFDEWCLTHPNAVGLRDFKFPYLRKLDIVWGKDRATGLSVEDVVDASMDANWQKNLNVSSSSDNEEEPVLDILSQGSPSSSSCNNGSKKRKKLSPRRESFYKKKKAATPQQTIDLRLDNFTNKFEVICDQMTTQYATITNALIAESKAESIGGEKMQEVIAELLNIGISPMDVGRAAEICYNDPAKVQVMFALPSHLRRSYVLGFIYPSSIP
ncbi:hypothetical protein ZIOFF_026376 [Zingiber officinale]|uniref:Uncharacterized protein n=1 Tax=Zingiber officinale TaxID=94328 RepID=A0A8J5HGJ7_ZINOF|nr:hypothetical protein ZIOFF_026376 [Zingiber officinale]